MIIKTNEITEMQKNFLHKCECLTYSNESTQFWKKKAERNLWNEKWICCQIMFCDFVLCVMK